METLAANVTHFFLQKHYIEPDQARMVSIRSCQPYDGVSHLPSPSPRRCPFCRLDQFIPLPVHLSFFANADGRLPRPKRRTAACWSRLATMFAALTLAKNLHSPLLIGAVLFAAALCIFVLAPANNASLHLTANEIAAIRPRVRLRLAGAVLMGCLAAVHLCTIGKLYSGLAAGGRCYACID